MSDSRHKLAALLDPAGRVAALALDQRGSLRRALQQAGDRSFDDSDLALFKSLVTEVLSPEASAILLDPQFGLPAAQMRAPGCGLLLAYEETGYDTSGPGRLPRLAEHQSVRRLRDAGADGIKLMVYYDPFDHEAVLDRKHALVERVGAECAAEELPLFLEPMSYSDRDEDPLERARRKPEVLRRTIAEFSRPRYRVDVLKIEFPLEIALVAGIGDSGDRPILYDRQQARAELQRATAEATVPFVFLSAGVDMRQFVASLSLAGEAGIPFCGVLCGRATWKGGIERYARAGEQALRSWLLDEGLRNIRALNAALASHAVALPGSANR